MEQQNPYQIFDVDNQSEHEVYLRLTSNRNIDRVTDVLTSYKHADFEERVHYAKQAGALPIARNEDGTPETDGNDNVIVEFEDRYLDAKTYWAGLAQALFTGCPQLVKMNDEGEAILNPETEDLNDRLIRGQVKGGLEDFLGKCGLKLYEQNSLFELFQIDPNSPNSLISQAANILQENSDLLGVDKESIKTNSKHGETISQPDTANGNS